MMREMVIIAGPHGIGKTQLALSILGRRGFRGTIVDPQEIHDGLKSYYAMADQAGQDRSDYRQRTQEKAHSTRFRCVHKGRSLTTICTLGEIADLDLFDAASRAGFTISLYYFGMQNWEKGVDYLKSLRNHWLAELSPEEIYNTYFRSIAMLPGAILKSNHGFIYDISRKSKPRKLLQIIDGHIDVLDKKLPEWVMEPLSRCL